MREALIVLCSAFFAVLTIWSLRRAFKTGEISSRGWTFQIDENPGGFFLVAFCHLLILLGSIWFALHTLGLVGDIPIHR